MCTINRIRVGPGTSLHWNGASVNFATLRRYLEITGFMTPVPFAAVFIRPDADCGLIARVRATVEEMLRCDGPYCSFALVRDPGPPPRRRRG
jgi:hypothetical protein